MIHDVLNKFDEERCVNKRHVFCNHFSEYDISIMKDEQNMDVEIRSCRYRERLKKAVHAVDFLYNSILYEKH